MSYLLEFGPTRSSPESLNSPPYVVFGIYGTNITSSIPPLTPLSLVLHFAPALRKWVLPAPDPAQLPHSVTRQSLRTSHVGVNILAPIDAVGFGWIIMRMLHLNGRKVARDLFRVHPDIATSLAIHNAWLALELPIEGLRGLHTHIHAQLMITSPPVCLWDMRMLWDTFPCNSELVKAMGMNFIKAHMNLEYTVHEYVEILVWLQSTPERYAFLERLQNAVPAYKESMLEAVPVAEEKERIVGIGYEAIDKKIGRAIKAAVAKEAFGQVGIRERGATLKTSPRERQEREASDFKALQTRLRRSRSDDSLRSVDTAIWDPQTLELNSEKEEEEESLVSHNMEDEKNYSGGTFSAALARTLEAIRSRRETRNPRNKLSARFPTEDATAANIERQGMESQPASKLHISGHRRSLSASTTEKDHLLSIADLESRIQILKEKQKKLAQEV